MSKKITRKTTATSADAKISVSHRTHAKYLALKAARGITMSAAADFAIDLLLKREGVKVSG